MCVNEINISGIVCAVPLADNFILQADNDYIHCVSTSIAPNVGDEIIVHGRLKSRVKQIYGRKMVLYEVEC